MISQSIISDYINKSKGYKIALFTTFNFDIRFFEASILNSLLNNNVKKISLFVDANNFYKALNDVDSSYIEQKYRVSIVDINKSFHPKLILLLGNKKARLIVGSANLSFSGYTQNNEVFNVFDYDENNTEYLSIINGAINYFFTLSERFNSLDKKIFEEIKDFNYYHRKGENDKVFFVSNLNESIVEQIKKIIPYCNSVDIAVPFFDNELSALTNLKEEYKNVRLYIQNELSTFDFKLNKEKQIVDDKNIFVYDRFKEVGTNNFYHGKVMRFNLNDCSYILYGSANCTNAALYEKALEGNYECCVLVKGKEDEFNYFFENFELVSRDVKYSNRKMIYNNREVSNYKFILTDEENKLVFKCKNMEKNLKVFIMDREYKYDVLDDKIFINIDNEVPRGIVSVAFVGSSVETVKGFRSDLNILREFRNSDDKKINISLDNVMDNKNENFTKYYKSLLQLIPYDINSLDEYKRNLQLNRDVQEQNNSEEEVDEEWFVDFDVPDEILNKQKEYKIIDSLREGVNRNFISGLISGKFHRIKRKDEPGKGKDGGKGDDDGEEKEVKKRRGKTEEERFVAYINRLFDSILDKKYLEICSLKQYIDNIFLLLNVITTYNVDSEKEVFVMEKYALNILEFVKLILSYNFEDINEEYMEAIKMFIFVPVIYGYSQKCKGSLDLKNELKYKKVLLEYDKMFDFNNNYMNLLKKTYDSLIDVEVNMEGLIKYVWSMINYKDYEELESFIKKNILGEVKIYIDNDTFKIEVSSNEINKYFKHENLVKMLEEIKKYSLHTEVINNIIIEIRNRKLDVSMANPIDKIMYVYKIKSNVIERYFKRLYDDEYGLQDALRLYL